MILLDSITLSSVSIIVKLFDIQFLLIGNVACGTRVQTARIVGGTIAKPGAWPWQVTMDYKKHNEKTSFVWRLNCESTVGCFSGSLFCIWS